MENNELWIELISIMKSDGAVLEVSKVFPKECFLEIDASVPLCSDITLKGQITNLSGSLFLKSTLEFSLKYNCDRCLTEYTKDYSVEFSDVIAKQDSGYEEGEYIPASGSRVLLTEAIYKEIYPLILERHLCRDDCKGLCTICGGNLNEKDCGCKFDEIDPRLEKLKDFFKD